MKKQNVVATTRHSGQMISHAAKLSVGYQVKSGGITRELDKEPLLNYCPIYTNGSWSMLLLSTLPYSPCSILMSTSLLTQDHHVYSMCPNIIFQTILPCSRLVTSHHVTCHVTSLSCAFFIIFPGK